MCPGSAITNRWETKSCLGKVFNSKLVNFTDDSKTVAACKWPLLKLKTRPRFCPVSLSLSLSRLFLSCPNSGSFIKDHTLKSFSSVLWNFSEVTNKRPPNRSKCPESIPEQQISDLQIGHAPSPDQTQVLNLQGRNDKSLCVAIDSKKSWERSLLLSGNGFASVLEVKVRSPATTILANPLPNSSAHSSCHTGWVEPAM